MSVYRVSDPVNQYDFANKRYVDGDHYAVSLNENGTISRHDNMYYSRVKSAVDNHKAVVLDVSYTYSDNGTSKVAKIEIPAIQEQDTDMGAIIFLGNIRLLDGNITDVVFMLNNSNQLSVVITLQENALQKVTDLTQYQNSVFNYPTVKGVFDTFQRKPVTVWEVADVSQGLTALNTNITANLAWQLTDLDLTPYKRIKVYAKAGRKTGAMAADSSIVPAVIIEMLLDDRAKETVSQNVFIGSAVVQNPNDANRLGMMTCAVSGGKTKFAVLRATTLYGTAATSNTDAYPYVFKIEGYYD